MGDYRRKCSISEIYDATRESTRIGQTYQRRLSPPFAHPRYCYPAKQQEAWNG